MGLITSEISILSMHKRRRLRRVLLFLLPLYFGVKPAHDSVGSCAAFSRQQPCLSVLGCPSQNSHLHTSWAERRIELKLSSRKVPRIIHTEKGGPGILGL